MEVVLGSMHPDVEWANGMEGGHEHGCEAVRRYWKRQWAMIDLNVEPVGFSTDGEGRSVVEVHQVVRDLAGNVLVDQMVGHILRIVTGAWKLGIVKQSDLSSTGSGTALFLHSRRTLVRGAHMNCRMAGSKRKTTAISWFNPHQRRAVEPRSMSGP